MAGMRYASLHIDITHRRAMIGRSDFLDINMQGRGGARLLGSSALLCNHTLFWESPLLHALRMRAFVSCSSSEVPPSPTSQATPRALTGSSGVLFSLSICVVIPRDWEAKTDALRKNSWIVEPHNSCILRIQVGGGRGGAAKMR